jgi:hypothetical protein
MQVYLKKSVKKKLCGYYKIKNLARLTRFILWEHTGSNRGPSACKADALNQLSYAPFIFGSANIRDVWYSKKFKSFLNFAVRYKYFPLENI